MIKRLLIVSMACVVVCGISPFAAYGGGPFCVPEEEPDVRTQGFWNRQCKGPHPSGEHQNLPAYVDCVNDTVTFADVDDVDALCDRLQPPVKNDKCEKAEAQFMALLLNLCSGRVAECNCVFDPDLGETTVWDVVELIDLLLSNPIRTFEACVLAQAIADAINSGLTLVPCDGNGIPAGNTETVIEGKIALDERLDRGEKGNDPAFGL